MHEEGNEKGQRTVAGAVDELQEMTRQQRFGTDRLPRDKTSNPVGQPEEMW